jgi:hypothetical protein
MAGGGKKGCDLLRSCTLRWPEKLASFLPINNWGDTMKSKSFVGAVTAAALFASSAFAADIAPTNAPLPAGKPAGAKEATLLGLGPLTPWILMGVIGLAIGLAASGTFNDDKAVPNTQGFQGQ